MNAMNSMSAETMSTIATAPVVYIVDDDDAVRFALQLLVESCGWNTRSYASAEEFIQDKSVTPNAGCLVLDLNMQGTSGADLLEAMDPAMPVIVITGYAESPLAERARRAGVRAILKKPFSDQLILGHIREALKVTQA